MKAYLMILSAVSLILAVIFSLFVLYDGLNGNGSVQLGRGPLSDQEKDVLILAIQEEYKAKDLNQQIMAHIGPVNPFYRIRMQEQMHINHLARLFRFYGLSIPVDRSEVDLPTTLTIREACQMGVQAEFDNAAFYDRSIPVVNHRDIAVTFLMLRDMSRFRHMPLFRTCADHGSG